MTLEERDRCHNDEPLVLHKSESDIKLSLSVIREYKSGLLRILREDCVKMSWCGQDAASTDGLFGFGKSLSSFGVLLSCFALV